MVDVIHYAKLCFNLFQDFDFGEGLNLAFSVRMQFRC